MELHGCTTPGDMHSLAIVGDTGWEERGARDGYIEYHGARFFTAPCLAAICAADAAMVGAGGVLRLACRGGVAVELESSISSSAAWSCCDGRTARHFTF